MRPDAVEIADLFELGAPMGEPTALAGGSSARRWALDTERGRWMVKSQGPPDDWQLHEMRVSGSLELAAHAVGVPMARPVPARAATVGVWAAVADGGFVRVSEWVEGVPPAVTDGVALAGWLGRTLAAIEGLGLPGDPTAEAAYPVHDPAEWRGWLDEAVHAAVLDRARAAGLRAAVEDATAVVRAALAAGPQFRLAHRDASRRNMLVTGRGPVLIDFDYAGPEVPWWEVVHHTFDLATPELGAHPPAPGVVRAALSAYRAAGATPGPAGDEAFAGLLRGLLNSAAYSLWLAVGHRPAEDEDRAECAVALRSLATRLPAVVGSLGAWNRLLG